MNVVPLPAKPAPTYEEVVQRLEELLAEARRGEIAGIAYVYISPSRDMVSWGQRNLTTLEGIALAARLQHNFQRNWDGA